MEGNERERWKNDGELSSQDQWCTAGPRNNLYKLVESKEFWERGLQGKEINRILDGLECVQRFTDLGARW